MRFIDADSICGCGKYIRTNEKFEPYIMIDDLVKLIDEQPTAYDIDKVVEELEEIKGSACDGKSCSECEYTSDCLEGEQSEKVAIDKAIEIVNQGGVSDDVCEWKYNDSEYYFESSCEHLHIFMSDGPKENEYRFCPYCGKKVKVVE